MAVICFSGFQFLITDEVVEKRRPKKVEEEMEILR